MNRRCEKDVAKVGYNEDAAEVCYNEEQSAEVGNATFEMRGTEILQPFITLAS